MTTGFFNQSFIKDALATADALLTHRLNKQLLLSNGLLIKQHGVGILEVIPSEVTSKQVVLSCGVHGDETGPIEVVDQLVDAILREEFKPRSHCLFIFANIKAAKAHQRFLTTNLNRLFKYNVSSEPAEVKEAATDSADEHELAVLLKQTVGDFFDKAPDAKRWHFDLHCSIRRSKHVSFAVSPKVSTPVNTLAYQQFLAQAGVEALVLSSTPSSTFSWFSAEYYGAKTATLELGKVARFGENDLTQPHLALFYQATVEFISCPTDMDEDHSLTSVDESIFERFIVYKVDEILVKQAEDFEFVCKDLINFESIAVNAPFFTEQGQMVCNGERERFILFPNPKVFIGERVALVLTPC